MDVRSYGLHKFNAKTCIKPHKAVNFIHKTATSLAKVLPFPQLYSYLDTKQCWWLPFVLFARRCTSPKQLSQLSLRLGPAQNTMAEYIG